MAQRKKTETKRPIESYEHGDIADTLRTIDRRIEAEERRKAALAALFNTLLHHLMTGKVRVRGAITEPEE